MSTTGGDWYNSYIQQSQTNTLSPYQQPISNYPNQQTIQPFQPSHLDEHQKELLRDSIKHLVSISTPKEIQDNINYYLISILRNEDHRELSVLWIEGYRDELAKRAAARIQGIQRDAEGRSEETQG